MTIDHTLSFQLYSSRKFPPVSEQLKALSALGYTNVEPYDDLYADLKGFAAGLQRAGLKSVSGHFSLSMLEDDIDNVIRIAKTLGMTFVITPWLNAGDRPIDAEGWKKLGARLSALRMLLEPHGLQLAWHNHDFEFVALPDGSYPIEHLMQDTGMGFEIDIAWVVRAGEDPTTWLQRYSNRIVAVHVKDIAPVGENLDQDGWTSVGSGVVDWPALWPLVTSTSARLAIMEHDNPSDWSVFASESAKTIQQIAAK